EVQGTAVQLGLLRAEAAGVADLHLTASGPIDRLTGVATIDVPALQWNGQPVGPLAARLEGAMGQGQFTVAAPQLHLTGEGTLARRTGRGAFTLDQPDVARLAALVPVSPSLTGTTSGHIDVSLPWADPRGAVVDARLDRVDLATGQLTVQATQPVEAHLR